MSTLPSSLVRIPFLLSAFPPPDVPAATLERRFVSHLGKLRAAKGIEGAEDMHCDPAAAIDTCERNAWLADAETPSAFGQNDWLKIRRRVRRLREARKAENPFARLKTDDRERLETLRDGVRLASVHRNHLAWLTRAMAKPWDGQRIVVTHLAPSLAVAGPINGLSPAFASDLDAWIKANRPDAWYYGHTHRRLSVKVHGVPVINVSLGYPHEVDVGRRHGIKDSLRDLGQVSTPMSSVHGTRAEPDRNKAVQCRANPIKFERHNNLMKINMLIISRKAGQAHAMRRKSMCQ